MWANELEGKARKAGNAAGKKEGKRVAGRLQ